MEPPLTYELHRLVWLMDALADRELRARHDITYQRFHPLAVLMGIEPATQHQLAVALGVTDAAVSRSIGGLVEAGLVSVGVSVEHRRHNTVALTPKGRRLAEACTVTLEEVFGSLVTASEVNGDAYLASTRSLLAALRGALGPPPDG